MFITTMFIPADEVVLPAASADFVFKSSSVPASWDLTRSTAGLGRGPDGRWTSYAVNAPRPFHDPVTKANRGTLLEPPRSQLVNSSRPLVSTVKAGTVTADTTTQTPFGLGATRLVDNATLAVHGFDMFFGGLNRAAAIPDGTVVSVQMTFAPIGGQTRGAFYVQLKTGIYRTVEFTVAGGSPTIIAHGVDSAKISPDTDGFFRLEFTASFGTGTSGGAANLSLIRDDGTRTYAGDGTRGFLIAHFGAEIGQECTSPILSSNAAGTSPATRGEDILTSSADWLVSGGKSFGVQYTPLGADTQVIVSAAGGDSVELLNSGGDAVYTALSSGTNIGPIRGGAPPAGTERTVVVTAGFGAFMLIQNGKLLSFSQRANESPPAALDSVRVGARVGGGFAGPVILNRLKYWDDAVDREAAKEFSSDLSIPGVTPVLPVIDIQATRSIPASDDEIAMSVTLTGPPTGASVSYRTIDGTALAGVDYTAASGIIVFGPGDNTSSISISLGTRSLLEDRSFTIELFTPRAAALGTARCVVTLVKSTPTAHAPLKVVTFDAPLSADWSLTRSTAGYARGADGIWASVAAGQPRIHHFAPGEVGTLLEPATTQCLFESINFGYLLNSTQSMVTTEQTPVGMRTKRWRETATTGNHLFRALWNTTGATWPTGDFILWCLVKPIGRTRYRMAVKGIDNIFRGAVFELSGAGSVILTTAADIIATVEPEYGWPGVYRIGIAKPQAVNAGVSAEFDIGPVDPDNNNSTTTVGNTSFGLDLYHFQCEPGLFWTSPIPVVAATAVTTRAADVLKAAGTWYHRESFALGVEFARLNSTPASQRIVQFRDIAPAVDDFGILTASGITRAPLTTGGVFQGQIDGAANVLKAAATAVVSIDTNRYAMWIGGTKAGEISMAGKDMPRQVEHLRFGSKEQDGSQGAPIVLKKIAYWTVGLSDEEGAVFSADLSGTPPGQVEPDPLPIVSIPATMSVSEGQSINIPVTKIGNGVCSVNFRTKGQTAIAGADYTGIGDPNPAAATARIVTFGANESTKYVTFQSLADAVPEPDNEKLGIEIAAFNTPPDCQIGVGVGVITILEAPTVAIQGAVSVTEGAAASITVTKTGTGACSVTYRTVGVTATVDADYTRTDATLLSFGASETSKTISIQTAADAIAEPNETFRVVIENPTSCTLGATTSCTVTIVDPAGGEAPPTTGIYAAPVGFATTVDAGIGQVPYYVTSLDFTLTTGTLRHALTQSNRVIVFEIGGRMEMPQGGMTVTGSNLTVAGETAPAPGIIIQGGDFKIGAVQNVHIRHITFERGHDDRVTCFSNGDGLLLTNTSATNPCENIWFDHCAILWGNDELVSMWPTTSTARGIVRNISFTNCIFAVPLWRPEQVPKPGGGYYRGHYEGTNADGSCKTEYNHNYGMIIGYTTRNIDIQYSAFVDCNNRCPFVDADTRTVIANNLMLNCSQGAWITMNTYDDTVKFFLMTVVGYLAITGPNSSAYDIVRIHDGKVPPTGSKVWAKGLYAWKGVGAPNLAKTTPGVRIETQRPFILDPDTTARPIDIPNAPVPILTDNEIYQRTKDNVGPRPKDRANGPVSVQKVMTKINTQSSTWVDHPSQVGGMSTLADKTRSLRDQAGSNPPKFKDGTVIPAFPTSTNKTAVRAWLRRFLDEVQYD